MHLPIQLNQTRDIEALGPVDQEKQIIEKTDCFLQKLLEVEAAKKQQILN